MLDAHRLRRDMLKTIRSPRHQLLQELLIAARRKADLTQTALAERLGRPQSFVAKYENGERRLDVIEFIEVMEAMRVDPKRLLAKLLVKANVP